MFERLIRVIGLENYEILRQKKILLLGVGGVGGYVLEALVRSGIEHITIADFDIIEETNLNRQVIATTKNIGCMKVIEAKNRALEINPSCQIQVIDTKIQKNSLDSLLSTSYDYIIDACDDVLVKVELMKICYTKQIKLISCMGTGNRISPDKLSLTTLKKTEYDPLAKKIRSIIRNEMKEALNTQVVCSKETPILSNKLGTVCPVPMAAGSLLASYVINDILKK